MLQELISQIDENNKELNKLTRENKNLVKNLIYKLPDWLKTQDDIHAICWTQYIPGFNDGDPCVFRLNEILLITNKSLKEFKAKNGEDSMLDDVLCEFDNYGEYGTDKKEFRAIESLIRRNQDAIESIFGENAKVIITKNGVKSEYYDCGY